MEVSFNIKERLGGLRELLVQYKINYYMVTSADYHNSEYVHDYFKVREYLSGFTGSNGILLVGAAEACLWTDGRYFIQAEKELEGTGIILFRMGEEGVPALPAYLKEHMQEGDTLGFDGRTVDAAFGLRLQKELSMKNISIQYEEPLADYLWTKRPAMPCSPLFVLPAALAGRNTADKLAEVRKKMREAGAMLFLLSKLDDIMWLFNIRGSDVACNPVALSYGVVEQDGAVLFIQDGALPEAVGEYLGENGIRTMPYASIVDYLKALPSDAAVLMDPGKISYMLYRTVKDTVQAIERENPTELLKAVKNETELDNMRKTCLLDSVAVTKFIYWLKNRIGREKITECGAAEYLDRLRRETEGFLDYSFPTISGYQENAAMMHYEARKDTCKTLKPEGMLLVDSGGQYLGGTTDVTRTIVLGTVTDEMKEHFTAAVSGMLQLSNAKFPEGCTGRNLDILARQPLWDMGIDYKCGTGHGVGYILNVHEGPHSIRWRYQEGIKEAVLRPGMVVTDEPGVYQEGSHGIRIENVLAVREWKKNSDGRFLNFETLTLVPVDIEAVDTLRMTEANIALLNSYHEKVYGSLAAYLTEEEGKWLKEVTAPIGK